MYTFFLVDPVYIGTEYFKHGIYSGFVLLTASCKSATIQREGIVRASVATVVCARATVLTLYIRCLFCSHIVSKIVFLAPRRASEGGRR